MRFRGRRLSGLPGLMLALALAGLLVMHGFDAHAATGRGDDHVVSPTGQHDMASAAGVSQSSGAMRDAADSARATSTGDAGRIRPGADEAAAGHAGLGHVMAMCMVVVAAAGTGVLRHRLGGVRARFAAAAAVASGRLRGAVDVDRPPGPGRLALCVLTC